MIEQTTMVVTNWHYHEPLAIIENEKNIRSNIALEMMKKTASTKKGIACRFTCRFIHEKETILEYSGEDSYVIDFDEKIDKHELLKMIRNSFSKFEEKFELRKLTTVLSNKKLPPLNESLIDTDSILPMLA
jgi:hypothetical protein